MKTNKSEMIRDAIRAAGEPVTAEYLASVTGLPIKFVRVRVTEMLQSQKLFIAGTAAIHQKSGQGNRDHLKTYELSEFAGGC